MKWVLHPSWLTVFLASLVIVLDIVLAMFGVIRSEKTESEVFFGETKEWFSERVESSVDTEVSGLGLGYLLGIKEKLPDGLDKKIRDVGMSHIIVVSGTHLAIIVGWARKIFGRFSRLVGVYFAILLLLVYIGIVGLTPSILRSGLVAILTLVAWYSGRKFEAWRIILIVAALTLLFNPAYILSVSWQLSMAAYVGILLIMPILTRFFYGPGEKVGLPGSTLLASVAATLACLPITLYYFGAVSLLSFVANLFILPTIPMAMGLTLAAGIFGGALFNIFGKAASLILGYHVGVVQTLSDYPELIVEVEKGNGLYFLLYIPIILLILGVNLARWAKFRGRLQYLNRRL